MKRSLVLAVGLLFAAFLVSEAAAQGAAQPVTLRVGIINTAEFDSKEGITRYLNAMNSLEAEFKPVETEIQQLINKYQALGAEIKKLQDQAAAGGPVPIDQKSAQAKVEEYTTLETTIKRKQEDGKARCERRQQQVLGPIMQDIGKAIQDFATQKGYDIILDLAKLDAGAMILAYNPSKADITPARRSRRWRDAARGIGSRCRG
ncbi:OmpH family outer membrane protein [Leptolyngbya sp. 15MV]|nr:OmpH family outer membrane protein [Leptolyngbya sp. 15MV]